MYLYYCRGDYNRLEFLGDAILKYVVSDYLFKKFPQHQEGHLTVRIYFPVTIEGKLTDN